MRIAVFGMGYVGLANAVLLANHHDVTIVDIDPQRVETLRRGASPIADRDIEAALSTGSLALSATTNPNHALHNADLAFIATPTDYDPATNYFNTQSVETVLETIQSSASKPTAVIKSTVPIGFTERVSARFPELTIVFSPEFLREGRALEDNRYPSRIISASTDSASAALVATVLSNASLKTDVPILILDPTEAEAVKLFANTYLAMRVAFFNEMDTFSRAKGLNAAQIIEGVSLDPRIGNYYNNPSFGYGGYCLPKDSKQLLANFDSLPQSLISAVVESNERRKNFLVDEILRSQPSTVGIYRLTMKSGSDNFRSSAIHDIALRLSNAGVSLLVFEPTLERGDSHFEIVSSIQELDERSDIILANRLTVDLDDLETPVFSADVYQRD